MIRVKVPLDLHAVATAGSGAFALATPLRVRDLLGLPSGKPSVPARRIDKFSRSMLERLRASPPETTRRVNGRSFGDPMRSSCDGQTADVRFFLGASSAPHRS